MLIKIMLNHLSSLVNVLWRTEKTTCLGVVLWISVIAAGTFLAAENSIKLLGVFA